MSISPSNPIIHQILKGSLTKYLILTYHLETFWWKKQHLTMIIAFTSCLRKREVRWLSSVSSAIAQSKFLRTEGKKCLTSYMRNIRYQRVSISQTMTLHWASTPLSSLRHRVILDKIYQILEVKKTMDENEAA